MSKWICGECKGTLINHHCGPCSVVNPLNIQLYCPWCKTHPMDLNKIE
jgi:hypothetical protein